MTVHQRTCICHKLLRQPNVHYLLLPAKSSAGSAWLFVQRNGQDRLGCKGCASLLESIKDLIPTIKTRHLSARRSAGQEKGGQEGLMGSPADAQAGAVRACPEIILQVPGLSQNHIRGLQDSGNRHTYLSNIKVTKYYPGGSILPYKAVLGGCGQSQALLGGRKGK